MIGKGYDESINVTVAGIPHSGKTIIISLFAKALADAGFTNVVITNPEEPVEDVLKRHERIDDIKRTTPEFMGKRISITEGFSPIKKATLT